MKISEVISRFNAQGVTFLLEEKKLYFSAPEGAVTSKIKEEIREDKSKIIEYLSQVKMNPFVLPPIERIDR